MLDPDGSRSVEGRAFVLKVDEYRMRNFFEMRNFGDENCATYFTSLYSSSRREKSLKSAGQRSTWAFSSTMETSES